LSERHDLITTDPVQILLQADHRYELVVSEQNVRQFHLYHQRLSVASNGGCGYRLVFHQFHHDLLGTVGRAFGQKAQVQSQIGTFQSEKKQNNLN
jgi:hypothetical protein